MNKHTQSSRRVQQTSVDSHHLKVLPSNVHMSAQPIIASLQQKLISKSCSSPSSSFQQDTVDKFTGDDPDAGQTFLVSTNSISKPERTAEVTMAHPVTPRSSLSNSPSYEDVDFDSGKEEASLEQSCEQGNASTHNTCEQALVKHLCL